ncbi:FtsK/SpoIIIE domain-containing protein [Pseudofrankia inefficax]|uniref:Cell division protein FtsK/SpoIIIE n=1 Tax=Pseudofrankia inefficax (strain DSM 45817 / CECT 9037 / DDB 130130 / EuI1c) TaxID=298654 RepID=E3J736_PSEI1|nr:FtsK/SpoIIIE domain-containing protein [Pseudofrankia inefficax]ADP84400.1 cell division protein FtsK/SpoIIIE [Pseudofrankia inefficax]
MTEATTDVDTPPGGLLVPGPWTPAPVAEPDPPAPAPAVTRPPPRRPALAAEPLTLPAWTRDATVARARAAHGARVAGRLAARGTVRSVPSVVGGGVRAGRGWWRWVQADDLADELRGPDGKLGEKVFVIRDHRKARWYLTGGLLLTASVGETVAAYTVGDVIPAVSGLVVAGAFAIAGRRRGGTAPALLGGIERDVRLELAPEHLNAAFRAAGMLRADAALILRSPVVRDRAGRGWEAVFDLPMGGGKTAAHAIAKRDVIAAELGVDEIQLIMSRIRARQGGNGKRIAFWVCDDDPYLGKPVVSPLVDLESFDFWGLVPFGQDARAERIEVGLLWQSAFFGGLPRRGKTFSMRLLVAAAVLDPWCRLYVADGKGGADFRSLAGVAHRYVRGADEADLEAFEAMLDELIAEMSRRFALFATLPTAVCPEGKLTPDIMRRYNLPLIPVVIDELQEYFEALETEKDRARIIGKLARIARRGPAAGFIPVYASQRPDAKSVPTKLREIVTYRYCTQVTDKTSSDMVLGDGKAAAGADASMLSEDHVGVGVLVTGPASFVTVKADLLDNPAFEVICQRGRKLRIAAGTLTGQAFGDIGAAAFEVGYAIPQIIGDVMEAFGSRTRIWTEDLLAALVNLDEDTYGDWDADRLAAELADAGVVRHSKQVKIDGVNRAGYLLRDVEGAIPPEVLAARPV